ncbi:MAG: PIN domain-containing protein [Planctomycetota bacterium]
MAHDNTQVREEVTDHVTDPVLLTGERGGMTVLRVAIAAVFIIMSGAVGQKLTNALNATRTPTNAIEMFWPLIGSVVVALALVAIDWAIPRKSISVISAVVVGLLVGLVAASLAADAVVQNLNPDPPVLWRETLNLGFAAVFCYLAISIILQTKDDFRFVIPYVEFNRERRGGKPLILDTSVIIDGRIADIVETKIIDAPLIIPRFILKELHDIADSTDRLRRNRGRRGLDVLARLQKNPKLTVQITDTQTSDAEEVDHKLVSLAKTLAARIVTNDFNLNKVAQVQSIEVININDLANALRPVVLPGEGLSVRMIKPGEEYGQGVGYLDDGTMVVVDNGRDRVGQDVSIIVTSVLQTSAGRMIFGRMEGDTSPPYTPGRRR